MALTSQDKTYIRKEIRQEIRSEILGLEERLKIDNRSFFKNEIEPFFRQIQEEHTSQIQAISEGFRDHVKMLAELIQDRPTRNEVHDMIKDQIYPVEQRLIRLEARI